MNRRLVLKQFAALAVFALSGAGAGALAQQPGQYQTLATPQPPVEGKGKVEVIEFFSYACPHCNEFEPLLERWVKTLPSGVSFIRVPVTFNREQWASLARLYYTLDALGEVERNHAAVFEAIHEKHIPLYREDALLEWAAGRGIDRKKFSDAYKSFGVQSRLRRADQLAGEYRVTGVPLIAVGGKYLVSASMTGGYPEMLKTVDQLVARERH